MRRASRGKPTMRPAGDARPIGGAKHVGNFRPGRHRRPVSDEVLATVEGWATASRDADISAHPPTQERRNLSDTPGFQDIDSDEILRELEEHHHRGQRTVRPHAPRGSAELQASTRRSATRAPRRTVRNDSASGSQHRSRRRRRTFVLGVLVPLTIAAGAVALSDVGGTGAPATVQRSSGRPAAETTPFVSTKTFGTLTALFVAQTQRLARADASSAVHRRRKPRTRKPTASRRVTRKPPATHQTPATQQIPATPVASPTTASSVASSSTSSSSAAAASTQSASSETARAASSQQSRPAFGQTGYPFESGDASSALAGA